MVQTTSRRILAFVLAGGNGTRLRPLTNDDAKPALPFAGGYRIIDFVLSNLFNSQIACVYVLAQYKPHSLVQHLSSRWGVSSRGATHSLEVLLPRRRGEAHGYRGTADAVYQNIDVIDRHQPELVAVFAADHVYRMDVRQMIRFHHLRDADVTVAAVPVPVQRASSFGIIGADADGRVREFQEKPELPPTMPLRPDHACASMGNYLFMPETLIDGLRRANALGEHDFGRHLLPRFAQNHRTYAYDFASNRVPGVEPCEERAYWRDIGTLEAYRAALRDVVGAQPRFSLRNSAWPIRGDVADRTTIRTPRLTGGEVGRRDRSAIVLRDNRPLSDIRDNWIVRS
ncbi:MAG: sugar phosphate nucleotidyltransferase [Casimicrobiaceae bacterium]